MPLTIMRCMRCPRSQRPVRFLTVTTWRSSKCPGSILMRWLTIVRVRSYGGGEGRAWDGTYVHPMTVAVAFNIWLLVAAAAIAGRLYVRGSGFDPPRSRHRHVNSVASTAAAQRRSFDSTMTGIFEKDGRSEERRKRSTGRRVQIRGWR
jgi:hypothetical protein